MTTSSNRVSNQTVSEISRKARNFKIDENDEINSLHLGKPDLILTKMHSQLGRDRIKSDATVIEHLGYDTATSDAEDYNIEMSSNDMHAEMNTYRMDLDIKNMSYWNIGQVCHFIESILHNSNSTIDSILHFQTVCLEKDIDGSKLNRMNRLQWKLFGVTNRNDVTRLLTAIRKLKIQQSLT